MKPDILNSIEAVKQRYLSIRQPKMKSTLMIQDQILSSLREFLRGEGFIEILAPIVGPATDPGIRGAKQATIKYYDTTLKVMSSMILYKQMAVSTLDKIFALSPNIRLEPVETLETRRHLTEFRQLDLEMAHASYDEVMHLAERMLTYVVSDVKKKCDSELTKLGRKLDLVKPPFERITHKTAIDILRKKGYRFSYEEEIPWEGEKALSEMYQNPIFVYDYPISSRGFYDREDPSRPGLLRDFDLLYPEGYGEAISGGEREHTVKGVLKRMKLTSVNPDEYGWYIDMLKEGVPHSAGFGIGVERLTRWICGLETIWEAVPFPKLPGIYSP